MQIQEEIAIPVPDSPSLSSPAVTSSLTEIKTIDCDLIAPWYEPVEHMCFGSALEQRRNAFLGDLQGVRTALSCGDGDGRFTTALLQANAQVEVTAVDASRKMVEMANRRVTAMGDGLQTGPIIAAERLGKLQSAAATSRSDCDPFLSRLFLNRGGDGHHSGVIAGWAAPRARWIVSEFCQPATPVGQLWTGTVVRGCTPPSA